MSGTWIQTFTGRQFYPLDPNPADIDIRDIAHSLALQCRYNGHSAWPYSVAQHSVLMARHVSPEVALWALLHDASEAYLCDIPRPIKPHLTNYKDLEFRVQSAILSRYDLSWPIPAEVHEADTRILLDERAALLGPPPADWNVPGEPLGVEIKRWTWQCAEGEFLKTFEALTCR